MRPCILPALHALLLKAYIISYNIYVCVYHAYCICMYVSVVICIISGDMKLFIFKVTNFVVVRL